MYPDIICLGELLVEIMRQQVDIPHSEIGKIYNGPYPSGAPAIFIDSVARMSKPFNLSTGIFGVVGNDEFGECIINKIKTDGVDISKVRILDNYTTGIAFNQYNSDGSRKFIFASGAAGKIYPEAINEKYFSNVKALHITGSALSISKSSQESCYKAIEIAKRKNPNVTISFDPNLRSEMLDLEKILELSKLVLKNTFILLPSGEEAEMLAGVDDAVNACISLLDHGPKVIVLKLGKKGCIIFTDKNKKGIEVPGFEVKEIDPTGAGDSFGGAFIVGYLAGWSFAKIGRFANAVGALKVQHFGPMPDTTYEDVEMFMKR
ncbi:MAG: carbohydrate kinase family protein [Promethearchaeota archaeon]